MTVGISIVASAITAAIVTKLFAAHYFKIVDGYVKDMCDMTNKSNENTLAIIRKLNHDFLSEGDKDIARFVDKFIQS